MCIESEGERCEKKTPVALQLPECINRCKLTDEFMQCPKFECSVNQYVLYIYCNKTIVLYKCTACERMYGQQSYANTVYIRTYDCKRDRSV